MEKCAACGGAIGDSILFEWKNMPEGAQIIPQKDELEMDKPIPLKLVQCKFCGLVQLSVEPVFYYKDAIRVGNLTKTMVDLRRKEFEELLAKYGMKGKKVIEIGCSTGEYVALMKEYGIDAYGLEHSEDSCTIARERNLNIFRGYLKDENERICEFLFDGFVCYNFLEHQPEPVHFLRGIYNNLNDNAYGLITVPSFDYMVVNSGLYEVIRDHLVYYTEDTLRAVLAQSGFEIVDISTINHDTLSAIVKKKRMFDLNGQKQVYKRLIDSINKIVKDLKLQGKKIAVWGASHQCFTALAETELGKYVEYIVDSSSVKQGRYSPVTHIPIVDLNYFFSNKADVIIIMAPGYAEEIKASITKLYGSDVKIGVLFADKIYMEG